VNVRKGERVLDLFTGVGPFALHCATNQNCEVYAVDVNCHAIDNLRKSMSRNKLKGKIFPIIGDSGRIFQNKRFFNRIIINLPEQSINYLPLAAQLLKKDKTSVIHLYQFINKVEVPEEKLIEMIREKLKNQYQFEVIKIRVGREISPSRVQMNVDLNINSLK
jgi:tRNA (guanine37-N1)-methyltransferase